MSGDGVDAAAAASSRPALRLAMGPQALMAAWCVMQRLSQDDLLKVGIRAIRSKMFLSSKWYKYRANCLK